MLYLQRIALWNTRKKAKFSRNLLISRKFNVTKTSFSLTEFDPRNLLRCNMRFLWLQNKDKKKIAKEGKHEGDYQRIWVFRRFHLGPCPNCRYTLADIHAVCVLIWCTQIWHLSVCIYLPSECTVLTLHHFFSFFRKNLFDVLFSSNIVFVSIVDMCHVPLQMTENGNNLRLCHFLACRVLGSSPLRCRECSHGSSIWVVSCHMMNNEEYADLTPCPALLSIQRKRISFGLFARDFDWPQKFVDRYQHKWSV